MIYYPLHVNPDNKVAAMKAPPVLFLTSSPKAAVIIGVIFTCLTLILGALLPLIVPSLGFFYFFLVVSAGVYALFCSIRLIQDTSSNKRGIIAFKSLLIFRLVISAAILITVFLEWI